MATRYVPHALERLEERGITQAEVELVLEAPESYHDDPNQKSVRLERKLAKGLLKVWVVAPWPDGDRVVVKSAAWKD